ncbi:MAG: hypothetical protein NZ821_09485, partial [Gloeomargarita sp. SKYB31]|nr:hypothetical protein [Gloeomargarita sp. SKYB31]
RKCSMDSVEGRMGINTFLGLMMSVAGAMVVAQPPPPTPTPIPMLPLDPAVFMPYAYPRDILSPLPSVRIDLTSIARATVTVFAFFSERGFLAWIAAFAILFLILIGLLRLIIRRLSSSE